MQIRTRVTGLFFLALALLAGAFVVVLVQRETRHAQDFQQESLRYHHIIWDQIAAAQQLELVQISKFVLEDPAFLSEVQTNEALALGKFIAQFQANRPGLRLDIFAPTRALAYSSSVGQGSARALLDAGAVRTLMSSAAPMTGMTQTSSVQFFWFFASKLQLRPSELPLAFVFGFDVSSALEEYKERLDADAYLLNLKGRLAHGTNASLFEHLGKTFIQRNDAVSVVQVNGKTHHVTRIGQNNAEGRLIGQVLTVRDVSGQANTRQMANTWLLAGLMAAVLSMLAYVFIYLRQSFQPLDHSLLVLADLAKGDTRAQLSDDIDDSGQDETARLARGMSLLREDMLNLEMMREERHRTGLQQERIIRDQLKMLADNLDVVARDEVLAQLERPVSTEDGRRNRLAELALTLGRLTTLISTQQKRLLQLLREIQEAAESKARLAGLQQELDIARKMQLAILPRTAPDRREFEVTASMIPAKDIGGDFYDYFMLDDEHLALVVADVSGKGVAAAFFMAVSRTLLKANAKFLNDPQACITELNELLCVDNDQTMFVTLFYGVLDLKTGLFKFVNAGHNPPVILRPAHPPQYLPPSPSMVLAVMEGVQFPSQEMQLLTGDTLVLYTDGITEATQAGGALYGESRLLCTLAALPAGLEVTDITAELIRDVRSFEAGAPQADDITCVVVRFNHTMT